MKPVKCSTNEIVYTYSQYLKTKHWNKKKRDFKKSDYSFGCCLYCGSKKVQIHHKTYVRIGREDFEDLIEVCAKHHRKIHKKSLKIRKRKIKKVVSITGGKSSKELKARATERLRNRNKHIPYSIKIENGMEIKVYSPR